MHAINKPFQWNCWIKRNKGEAVNTTEVSISRIRPFTRCQRVVWLCQGNYPLLMVQVSWLMTGFSSLAALEWQKVARKRSYQIICRGKIKMLDSGKRNTGLWEGSKGSYDGAFQTFVPAEYELDMWVTAFATIRYWDLGLSRRKKWPVRLTAPCSAGLGESNMKQERAL